MKDVKGLLYVAVWIGLTGSVHAQSKVRLTEVPPANELRGEDLSTLVHAGLESLQWGVLLEAEAGYSRAGSVEESDIKLATFEFVMDAAVNDWLGGHVGFLWEEDDTDPVDLDEGYIILGGEAANGFYGQAGKFYLPFGNFETAFISDPLTLELAEINKSSAMAGYATEWFDISAGVFKGDEDDVIQCGYAAVNFNVGETAVVGAYVLSDLLEADGFADLNTNFADRVAGAGGYVNVFVGPLMLNAEVVSALDTIDFGGGEKMQPVAYNLEASCAFSEKWAAGLKYEGSDEFYTEFDAGLGGLFYETGIGGVVSYGFHDNAVIGVEYMRQLNKGADDADLVTVQLALEI
ncbi:LbtU family siderophore porin [Pontiella agarivorans]|uniref:LbtU family siderophore porin n=1 Tax=Pontiella agarivorans TaxID=3038953 RepID=A0ABU5MXF9_9BACT|nr:LbtU family siderophore porin [Pontiella agarivorans]MDZ8118898.1 LbtU family siderophore porin [Pontiella agarivorans]